MRPTRRAVVLLGAGALLALAVVTVAPSLWPWWLAYCLGCGLALLVDGLLSPRLSQLEPLLQLPPRLPLGARVAATLRLQLPWSRPTRALVHLDHDPLLAPVPDTAGWALVPPEATLELPLIALRRGRLRLDALWLRVRGPLGLLAAEHRFPLERTVPAVPNLDAARHSAMRRASSRSLTQGLRVERHAGDGREFDHLREYVPGNDLRTIDWKASARHGKMLCRRLRAERNRQIVMVVDSGRLMREPLEGVPRLDHAIASALVLAQVCLQAGDRVGLAAVDERLRHFVAPRRGTGAMPQLHQVASRIEYSTAETNFTLALAELAQRQTRRSLLVVFTDFVDSVTAELLVESLGRLAERHLLLFVALQDPLLRQLAHAEPLRPIDLHTAVVAQGLLDERELVLRRLQRKGILCIDAAPAVIGGPLIDRYLDIKRRELL